MLFGAICVVVCVFFCCLFVLAPRMVFYRFLFDVEHIFDPICGVCWTKVEVVFLITFLGKTMIFKVPGPPLFSVFCNLFRIPFRTSFFIFLFCDFWVAKAPVLELVGLSF